MKFETDQTRSNGYLRLHEGKVAYSVELSPGIVADYDESGGVIGVETIGAKNTASPATALIAEANRRTLGKSNRTRTPPGD